MRANKNFRENVCGILSDGYELVSLPAGVQFSPDFMQVLEIPASIMSEYSMEPACPGNKIYEFGIRVPDGADGILFLQDGFALVYVDDNYSQVRLIKNPGSEQSIDVTLPLYVVPVEEVEWGVEV